MLYAWQHWRRLPIHCWDSEETELKIQYDSVTWKVVLKRPFTGETGKASTHSLFQISWETEHIPFSRAVSLLH